MLIWAACKAVGYVKFNLMPAKLMVSASSAEVKKIGANR